MLNINLFCDDSVHISFQEVQSNSQDISNFFDDESFDDLFRIGDINADPSKGNLLNILENQMLDNSLNLC